MNFKIEPPVLNFPNSRQRRTATNAIVVHHLDAQWDVNRVHAEHIRRGWNGIGYNFHVSKTGVISEGRGMEFVGSHTNPPAGTNSTTIGIGCEGQYDSVDCEMPDVQFNALVWLIKHLRGIYGDIPVRGHNEFAGHSSNDCPGQFFPLTEIKQLKFRGLDGEKVVFNDTNGHWAEQTINELFKMGIVNGDGDGNFRPNDTATRAEVAAMIRNAVRFVTGE